MSTTVNAAMINRFITQSEAQAKDAIKNHTIDTEGEKAIFAKKCKTVGLNNIDEILSNYNENKVQMEADYQVNRVTSDKSVETAVISAFNSDSALRVNDKSIRTANTIKAGIKNADENTKWWNPTTWFNDNGDFDWTDPSTWFNNQEEVLESVALVDENNVAEVVADSAVVNKIAEADENVRNTASTHIIDQLVKYAQNKQIDVSNIVAEQNGEYVVGSDVKGVKFGEPVSENFTAVINALKSKINNDKNTVAGNDAKKAEMLTIAAKRIDAQYNGNGYIDTDDETEDFKQFAAQHGYDVDTILEQIRDNETNGVENTTTAQKLIFNIFDPEQKAEYEKHIAQENKDVRKELEAGVENGDNELHELYTEPWDAVASFFTNLFEAGDVKTTDGNKSKLDNAISKVNSDNVMDILNKSPKLVDKIMNKYSHNWFVNLFGCDDKYAEYTTPILEALIEKANNEGIEIDDIIINNGNKYIAGSASGCRAGSQADSEDNVAKVISALQNRINKANA